MSEKLFVKNTITLNAAPEKVWNALVNPQMTKQYMFGCEALSDWKIGSPLLWQGNYEGKEMVFVKGNVKDFQPEKFLAYTTIDPNNTAIPDIPENYLTVTYSLIPEGNGTLLTVSQGDYASVADGANRYKETKEGGGWQPILDAIKKLIEPA